MGNINLYLRFYNLIWSVLTDGQEVSKLDCWTGDPCLIHVLALFRYTKNYSRLDPDNSNVLGKSKKVRVIGGLKQITGNKEISKWMGREYN